MIETCLTFPNILFRQKHEITFEILHTYYFLIKNLLLFSTCTATIKTDHMHWHFWDLIRKSPSVIKWNKMARETNAFDLCTFLGVLPSKEKSYLRTKFGTQKELNYFGTTEGCIADYCVLTFSLIIVLLLTHRIEC